MKKQSVMIGALAMASLLSACSAKQTEKSMPTQAETQTQAAAESTQAAAETTQAAAEDTQVEAEAVAEEAQPAEQGSALLAVDAINHYNYQYIEVPEVDSNVMLDVEYMELALSEEDAARYPALQAALEAKNAAYQKEADTKKADLLANATSELEEAKKEGQIQTYEDISRFDRSDCSEAEVVRADSRVLSYTNHFSAYSGGAHGMAGIYGYNLDPESGRELTTEEVFKDRTQLADTLKCVILEKYSAEEVCFLDDYLSYASDVKSEYFTDYNFVLGNEGAIFYFNPYDIAPYASGMQCIALAYREYEDLFKQDFTTLAEGYVEPMENDFEYRMHVNGNPDLDTLALAVSYGGDGYSEVYTLQVNGVETTLDDIIDAYSCKTYHVHTGEGDYIWLQTMGDNDYMLTYAYAIQDNRAVLTDYRNISRSGEYISVDDQDDYKRMPAFNDPSALTMDTRMYALGTYGGHKTYHVGEGGVPVSENPWFTVSAGYDFPLTVIKAFTARRVDEDGSVGDAFDIQVGDTVNVQRTDNETFVDVLVNGQDLVRLDYDNSDYPNKVCGEDENDLFEMIPYAG